MFPTATPPLTLPPPDVGPEPAGLAQAVAQRAFGAKPAAPLDPYKNTKELKKLFERLKKEATANRHVFERQWWRSLYFFLGRQWIYYSKRNQEWRDVRLAQWIPKPVTNKIRENGQAFRSTLAAIQLHCLGRPVGNEEKQLVLAALATDLEVPLREEHQMDLVMDEADFWFTYTGNVFLHTWYDPDADPVVNPGMECLKCGAPMEAAGPQMGGMPPTCQCGSTTFLPGLRSGELVGRGKGCTDVCSPFEILVPPNAQSLESAGYIIRQRWRDKDYYEDRFGKDFLKGLQFSKAPNERSLQLFRSLSTQNDLQTGLAAFASGAQPTEGEGIAEFELWMRPTATYPGGLVLRVLGESELRVFEDPDQGLPGPFPLRDSDGTPLMPWVHMQFERVGGRIWGGSFVDPAVQKQIQLNQLDSFIQLAFERTSNPIWLEPKGAEVEKFTGQPGLVVKWNPLAVQGQGKPERIAGENLPASLFQLRQQYIQDIEDLLGTHDVIKGNKPAGVEAFSALQLLVERSQSRFARAFSNRGEAYRKWYALALEIERNWGPEERLINVLGPNQGWSSKTFKNADLQGQVRIVVEDGTQAPKTALGFRAALDHANQLQILNPQNPDTIYEILRSLGLSQLMPSLDADVKECLREQEAFEEYVLSQGMKGAMLIREPWHNDEIHLAQNRKWMNSDRFRELVKVAPEVREVANQHLMEHYMPLAAAQMAASGGVGGPEGPGSGKDSEGGGQTMRNSNRESTKTNEPGGPGQKAGPA